MKPNCHPLVLREMRPILTRPVVTEDVSLPGTAKVRLNVARLSDIDLLQTCKSHALAAHDNPLFPDLQPSEAEFQFLIDDFSASVIEIADLKSKLEAAYARRDDKRAALEGGTRSRISYAQLRGQGASTAIMSIGFNTQRAPKPVGYLDSPLALTVTLNQNAGSMEITWQPVKRTRGYLLQYAEGTHGQQDVAWTLEVVTKPKKILTGMKLGTSYLFRIATLGGKGGQSAWSPSVVRVAG